MKYLQQARSAIWNFGAAVFFLYVGGKALFLGIELFAGDTPNICTQTNAIDFPSPSGARVARVSTSDCGAFTRMQTGVLLIDVRSGDEYSGVFGIDGLPEDFKVHWEGDDTLVFSDFPREKLQWFNQKHLSGVRFKIQ